MVRRQLIVGFGLLCVIACCITAIWYSTRIQSLQITEVTAVGGFTIPHELMESRAETELVGTYFRLIPKRFLWLYPHERIVASLMSVDRVKQVEVTRSKQTIRIAFEEFQPFGLWCTSVEDTECWFIDHTGLAFARSPELTGSAFVRFISDVAPAADLTYADSAFISETEALIEKLEQELDVFVTHVIRVDDLDVEYIVAGGGRIKFSQSIPTVESFNNLRAILLSPEFEHLEPGSFNYIDLRFGDKVFVNEVKETEQSATSTASSTE